MSTPTIEITLEFRSRLLEWGKENTRKYPWRWVEDSYSVLVSELMLHRTQAKQVVSVYERFMMFFPTLEAFSQSDEVEVRQILKPLGLQWRIDGMINALKHLWTEYHEVPLDLEKLVRVAGIGNYVAGATLCFSNDEPLALVDTNSVRVVGRVLGLDLRGEARRRKEIVNAIAMLSDPKHPRDFYYAMIDFAHQICKPHMPACYDCPLLDLPCTFGNDLFATTTARDG